MDQYFSAYLELGQLHLGHNNLQVIHNYTFIKFGNLKILFLNHNIITSVATQAFYGLHNLSHLHLDHNRITGIYLADLPMGVYVYLENNPLYGMAALYGFRMTTYDMYKWRTRRFAITEGTVLLVVIFL